MRGEDRAGSLQNPRLYLWGVQLERDVLVGSDAPMQIRPEKFIMLMVDTWMLCHLELSTSSYTGFPSARRACTIDPTLFIPAQNNQQQALARAGKHTHDPGPAYYR